MKKIQLALIACGVALLATGCGGGGSSSSAGTPAAAKVSITTTNAAAVSKGAVSSSKATAQSGSSGAAIAGRGTPTAPQQSLINIALAQIKRVETLKLSTAPTGVVGVSMAGFPMTLNCATFAVATAGSPNSETIDIQGTATAITSASMTFNACVSPSPVAAGATETLNGGFAMTVSSQTGLGTVASPKVSSIAMTFTNFSSVVAAPSMTTDTSTISGGFNIATSNNGTTLTATISGTSLAMNSSVDGAFTLKNFSIADLQDAPGAPVTGNYSESYTMTTNCAALNGDIDITTPVPFTGTGAANPTAGKMVITGANGSSITLTANANGTVTQVVNDGTNPATTTTVSWAAL